MKIAPAEKQDLDALHALESTVFGHHAHSRTFFRQAFDCWRNGFLVAKEEGQVSGSTLITTIDEENTHWVLSLAVNSERRGQGIARLLMEHALSKVNSGSLVKLTVDPNNAPAFKLYRSLGFTVVGEEDNYYGDGEPRLVMQLIR